MRKMHAIRPRLWMMWYSDNRNMLYDNNDENLNFVTEDE